jgi:hypothetical protein
MRRGYEEWLLGDVIPTLDPITGSILILGSLLHNDSCLSNIVKGNIGGFDDIDILPIIDSKGESQWPEMWPIEKLEQERLSIGPSAFDREYLCNPVDDINTPFRMEWLEKCKDSRRIFMIRRPEGMDVFQSWDLSAVIDKESAKKMDSSYTVGTTIGIDRTDKKRTVLRGVRRRGLTPVALSEMIQREAEIMKPDKIIIESNAFQNLYTWNLIRTTDLPIVRHITGTNKIQFAPTGMAYLFEYGKYCLPCGDKESRDFTNELIEELYGYKKVAHADIVMTLWFLEVYIRNMITAKHKNIYGRPGMGTPQMKFI